VNGLRQSPLASAGGRVVVVSSLIAAVTLAEGVLCVSAGDPRPLVQRQQIGEVLGKPVYRDQLRIEPGVPIAEELHDLFLAPLVECYREAHSAEIEPTAVEIDAATAFFKRKRDDEVKGKEAALRERVRAIERELSRHDLQSDRREKLELDKSVLEFRMRVPNRAEIRSFVADWRFQRHLYERFGGGRVLWQQAGFEAFDAMRRWLEMEERCGHFKIIDPKLRVAFYQYWKTASHGPFLFSDGERIRAAFLEPQWLKAVGKH
jgi:hypothetical protein